MNQSIPFSFLSVEVSANDGQPHQVHPFTRVAGDWVGQAAEGADEDLIWEITTGGIINHRFWLKNQTQLIEVGGRIRDGSAIYSTKQVPYYLETQLRAFSKRFRPAE